MALALIMTTSFTGWADTTSLRSELIVVVGILKEARIARGRNVSLIVSATRTEQLSAALRAQNFEKVRAVISFGVAGGLNPDLQPGDIVIPKAIVDGEKIWYTDTALSTHFTEQLQKKSRIVHRGILAGSNEVLMTPEAKAQLRTQTHADIVDMESHIAAEFAEKNNIPFVAIRAVSDPATRALPPAAANAVTKRGGVNIVSIIAHLLREPRQLFSLLNAGRDSSQAFKTLEQCQSLLQMR
jgi:hopanoid-associated phosphorylase